MKNERNAGRKSKIEKQELEKIKTRIADGEKVSVIAKEYGISRQALHRKLSEGSSTIVLDYVVDDICATRIEMDLRSETLHVINYAQAISKRAFGIHDNPVWNDLIDLLIKQYCQVRSDEIEDGKQRAICFDKSRETFTLQDVLGKNLRLAEEAEIPKVQFRFDKKDILYTRTDTDGFQLKALSQDRRWFVKSQAIFGGKLMDDWAVEMIAADICQQLGIPCVMQRYCEFVYGSRTYKGVYSANFELDGYSFVSFESLLARMGLSSNDNEFVRLDAIAKMKWCADKLAVAGNLQPADTLRYMLDLALVDCLVGNVDRHTRNFGLFYNAYEEKFEIPLIFDNGMGLFEYDSYEYETFEDAMMTVYVAPYGEDPFDMIRMLDQEYDLRKTYPGLSNLQYKNYLAKPFATEYMERMGRIWQK